MNPYANNGGKRRRHIPPALNSEALAKMETLRAQGCTFRRIAKVLGVSSATISLAINHQGAYARA